MVKETGIKYKNITTECAMVYLSSRVPYIKILEVTNKALMFESFLKLNMWKK